MSLVSARKSRILSFPFIPVTQYYSSSSLIRPPYLPRNCGHIREVALGEREKYKHLIVAAKICGLIKEGGPS